MEVLEAIMTRRMVPLVGEDPPSREQVETLLDAAVRAPTHHLTQPWRFIVLKDGALEELGEAMARRVAEEHAGDPNLDHRLEVERKRPLRAPVLVVVVYRPSTNPKAIEVEDRYAVGAAVENMLLAAHSGGLGAYWRTGPAAEYAGVKEMLGLAEGEEIASFLYLGHPAPGPERSPTAREDARMRTEWRGWD